MNLTFEDRLVQMHDQEFSLPTIAVALDQHLALTGGDAAAERRRLAAAFRLRRQDTILSQEIADMILGGPTTPDDAPPRP